MNVRLGCERLFDDACVAHVRHRRVGLVTNHSGVDDRLRSTADRLHTADDVDLALLFGPEHGIRGDAEDGVTVDTGIDAHTGVPAISLYGDRRQPSVEELADLDVLLFDIQDVGVRFYTYLYTMSLSMVACAEAGVPIVVLDRPNPVGGVEVEGNILDPAFASFVGLYPIPVQYGLTVGELARLFNEEFGIGAELHVIDMLGWHRNMSWQDTGLPWVAPSPNMPTQDTASVYPGMCFFEGTNISEGRGTTRPFEQVGAPYIDGFALADELNGLRLPGALFRPVFFRPAFAKYEGQSCAGVQLHVTDHARLQPVRVGFEAIAAVRRAWPDQFAWRTNHEGIHNFDKLAGSDGVRLAIDAGTSIENLLRDWAKERIGFEELRQKYLHYPL
ncbi:MAG TPA: DUF1343 domain-containing protein [Candidatus Handelsmanbacteria bacterium]|nr:DUF1343 domain-containing protein [Candidatus Handelsmanbacteria bacterium]